MLADSAQQEWKLGYSAGLLQSMYAGSCQSSMHVLLYGTTMVSQKGCSVYGIQCGKAIAVLALQNTAVKINGYNSYKWQHTQRYTTSVW